MSPIVEILADKPALVTRAQALAVETIKRAISANGKATLALSGGSTPKPLYAGLAKEDLPWEKIYIFWGDERYVPHDHEKSNVRMTREAWLNHVSIPTENVFPMPTSAGDPAVDAANYESTLKSFFQLGEGEFAAIDFVLQGMGDDGHTASLFPHTDALSITDRLVTVGNNDGDPRITFTAPLINHGKKVVFLVAGENKQQALAQVFSANANPKDYPSKLIQPESGPHWLLDEAAGKGVPDQFK
ncbi:MAG: 6-phosphogluconolactonase [Cyanobacteria bacterium P01_D01_bin.36]